ncbi:MAG: hypothetical protein JXA99_15385 [Candidatus Lokiarchaeota archaeon]|nr:hypothetical protein [Candidatus Lokiarchaeota archaeon]
MKKIRKINYITVSILSILILFITPTPTSAQLPTADIVYIYNTDLTTANNFKSLIEGEGYSVSIISVGAIIPAVFINSSLVIIGYDTGSLSSWGDTSSVSAIQSTSNPIIGIGEGGYAFFGKLGLNIGHPYGLHFGSDDTINVVENTHPIFNNTVPAANVTMDIYDTSSSGVEILSSSASSNINHVANTNPGSNYYILIEENEKCFLWGFDGGPTDMSDLGRILFLNLIDYYMNLSSSSGIPGFDVYIIIALSVFGIVIILFRKFKKIKLM